MLARCFTWNTAIPEKFYHSPQCSTWNIRFQCLRSFCPRTSPSLSGTLVLLGEFHVEHCFRHFSVDSNWISGSSWGILQKSKKTSFRRYADISFFFPTKRYLRSDLGIKTGSSQSQFLSFRTSSRSRPPIQRITWRA